MEAAFNSHGNYIVFLLKKLHCYSWKIIEKSWNCVLNFCGNPVNYTNLRVYFVCFSESESGSEYSDDLCVRTLSSQVCFVSFSESESGSEYSDDEEGEGLEDDQLDAPRSVSASPMSGDELAYPEDKKYEKLYSKTCLKRPFQKRPTIGFQYRL